MRVKARLTSNYLRQVQQPPVQWENDITLNSMTLMFTADPLIASDERGWFLSASSIDVADSLLDGSGTDVAEQLLNDINGACALLRVEHETVTIVDYDGRLDGNRVRISSIRVSATNYTGLNAGSASSLLKLAEQDEWVHRVLELLRHVDRDWIWVDLWRIWDVVIGGFQSGPAFRTWVETHATVIGDHFYDFERSANDPTFGANRRHSVRVYDVTEKRKINPRTGLPGDKMSDTDALRFIKQVVALWIERDFGVKLITEWS